MALKLGTEAKVVTIPYPAEIGPKGDRYGETLATFKVRNISPTEQKELLERYTTQEWISPDRKTKKELKESVDWFGITCDKIDKMIVGWEGIELVDPITGKMIDSNPECNRKNKLLVFEYNTEVINYIMDKANEFFELNTEREQGLEKNSESGQNGKAVQQLER